MPLSKIEAFYREFPWLARLIGKKPWLSLKVQRMDLDLYRRERIHLKMGFWFSDIMYEKIYALGHEGEVLGQVGYDEWMNDIGKVTTDTLEHLFHRLKGDASRVEFVVSIYNGSKVTIFKTPKGKTVLALMEEEIQKAQTDIKTQLAEINEEKSDSSMLLS